MLQGGFLFKNIKKMCENDEKQLDMFEGTTNNGKEIESDIELRTNNEGNAQSIDESERFISERNEYIKLLSTKIKTTNDD